MAKSGPEPSTGTQHSFDGDESTEVMAVPITPAKAAELPPHLVPASAKPKAEAPPALVDDIEDRDKKYFAPRVIPAAAVPDKQDAAKIVLNIPDARPKGPPAPPARGSGDKRPSEEPTVVGDKPAVAEVRARRRAATVKIARNDVANAARGLTPTVADAGIDVSLDDDFEPPPPLDVPASQSARPPAAGAVQAVPSLGLSPPPLSAFTSGGSAPISRSGGLTPLEAPATALPVRDSASRADKSSRLPWVVVALAAVAAAGGGVFVATRQVDTAAPAGRRSAQATAAAVANATADSGSATATAAPPATAETGTAVAAGTTSPSASASLGGVAANVPPPAQTPAVAPPAIVTQRPTHPLATTPPVSTAGTRPTPTFPRPPPKKTSDIPTGI